MNRHARLRMTRCIVFAMMLVVMSTMVHAETLVRHFQNTAHGLGWLNWIKEQIPRFEAQNPDVKIELSVPTSGSTAEQFMVFIASGVNIEVSELVLRMASSVASQGGYHDLRPFLQRSSKVSFDNYVPVARTAMTRPDGMIWGVPVDLYVVPTHYHADMFAQAGLATPAELGKDWNFDAALAASKRLTIDRDGDGIPEQWGTHNAYTLWVYRNAFENRGAKMFDRDIEPTRSLLNTPKVIEALQWVADLHLVHNVAHFDSGNYSAELPKGIYAWSMGTGPNTSQLLLQANVDFRWGVALPIGGEKQGSYTAVNSFQIPVTAENTEAAWRWIEFLTSDPECIQSYIVHTNRLPANQKFMTQWMRVLQNTPNPPEGVENYIEAAIHPDNYVDILSPHYAYFEQTAYPLIRNEVLQGQRDPRAVLEQLHQLMTARFAGN
ncbi:MAG: extracellular solute-binding protein [Firmicutes bacterium]|nr:extracellular solute-binding protein [Bacillota bacterium]